LRVGVRICSEITSWRIYSQFVFGIRKKMKVW
jgi:hypothetical protein